MNDIGLLQQQLGFRAHFRVQRQLIQLRAGHDETHLLVAVGANEFGVVQHGELARRALQRGGSFGQFPRGMGNARRVVDRLTALFGQSLDGDSAGQQPSRQGQNCQQKAGREQGKEGFGVF